MHSVKLGLVAAAMLMGTTALTTPAFASGSGDTNIEHSYNCNGNNSCPTNNNDNDTYNNEGGEGGEGGNGYGGNGYGGNGGQGGQGGQGGEGGTGYGGDVDNHNYNDSHNKAYGGKVENENYNDSHNKAYGGKVENENYNDSHNKAYGGDAKAYGGEGGSVKDSGNSYNENENKAYGGKAEINHSGNSKIEDSGNSYVDNHNKNYQDQDQQQQQKQKQDQHQHQSIEDSGNSYNENDNSNSNNANLEVNTYNQRAPVNTAYAAGLSVGEDTCMGSSSIGAQAVSFGLSIGTTWQDDNCRRLKNSRQLVALGYHRAATSLMCVDEDVRQAMIMAGTPCPNGEAVAAYVAPPAREYVPMAPVADDRPMKRKKRVRKALPPK